MEEEAEDDNLFSSMQPSVVLSDGEKSILKKGLDGFPKATINGTEMYSMLWKICERSVLVEWFLIIPYRVTNLNPNISFLEMSLYQLQV